jgi:hypothetical protein
MSETTFQRRLAQLKEQIMQHPHRAELLELTQQQLVDDTFVLSTARTGRSEDY